MRLIYIVAAAALAVTGLAACGQSDEEFRAMARQQIVTGCQTGSASMRATMERAGVDVNRYCSCATDKFMQSASTDRLREINRNPGMAASDPNMERAAEQCVREQVPNIGATPTAPSGTAPAPANEAAEAPGMAPDENRIAEQ